MDSKPECCMKSCLTTGGDNFERAKATAQGSKASGNSTSKDDSRSAMGMSKGKKSHY